MPALMEQNGMPALMEQNGHHGKKRTSTVEDGKTRARQDGGWHHQQDGSQQDAGWQAGKNSQGSAGPGVEGNAKNMACSLDIKRTHLPSSNPMPEDPDQRKHHHEVLPQFAYRIVCPDLDCLKN